MGMREVETVIDKIGKLLCHTCSGVRRVGVETLARVAPVGQRAAISKALRSMEDRDDFVRLAAADAVVRLTPKGEEQTISGVRRLFHRRNAQVRLASLLVLGK